MKGPHDLGGKSGYGPIPIGDDSVVFQRDWERRIWAMSRNNVTPGITIDWFRHGIECMVESDYANFSYFNKWCANMFMLLIDGETVTMDEAIAGHMTTPFPTAQTKTLTETLDHNRNANVDYSVETDIPPRFVVGNTVQTKTDIASNHNRLPGYASNARGTIIAHHGAHLLPDKGAQGIHVGEHLYTVSFSATELWGADANPLDTVTLELWESYFV